MSVRDSGETEGTFENNSALTVIVKYLQSDH